MTIELAFILFVTAFLFFLALYDLRYKKAPNKAISVLLVCILIYNAFKIDYSLMGFFSFLFPCFLLLVMGVILYKINMIGMGDAKLFGIIGLAVNLEIMINFLFFIIFLTLFYYFLNKKSKKVAYIPIIFISFVLAVINSL